VKPTTDNLLPTLSVPGAVSIVRDARSTVVKVKLSLYQAVEAYRVERC
jgi:hypothetical protein